MTGCRPNEGENSAPEEHRRRAREQRVRCAVITVSDTRTAENDTGGALIKERLTGAGHQVVTYRLVPDEPRAIRAALVQALDEAAVDAVLLTGGTGIASRDRTPDVVRPLFDRELPGFGELFRVLSYHEIGAAAMLSRATAGIVGGAVVFCLPGSPGAVRLALEQLILPELRHLIAELRR